MKLDKRHSINQMEHRAEVAETILESLDSAMNSYADVEYDTDTSGMGWSERVEHIVHDSEGMTCYTLPEVPEDDPYGCYQDRHDKAFYALEARNIIYNALMEWIDGESPVMVTKRRH